ncbi:hypothetical protein A1O3_05704 [Capronia epimyces CBS 606.96]|uniref:Zn(2)-C6 fungal-type domain-containing protein n=1 Tax=Capronia epimyces CBS 606.96 TaxID=1182542 RepID=W9YRX3_9EURO|nr:uncharacterized protein A1O3_05704 [Capronia epimyces CBS 606.96]EXJ85029.1 hypothetical protein A1O3_05704 [Capronia epimyces CBS 606.96]
MVFIGKPSRACAHCRRRKLRVTTLPPSGKAPLTIAKCDLRRAACGQCVRAGLTCSGYRDPDQLRIRDESESTRQRALSRRSKLDVQTIQISIEEAARAAFFSHYVNGLAKTYDVLGSIDKQSPLDKHLAASVEAASLAFFYFQHYSVRAARPAREKYLLALSLVNRALGSPDLAARDSTLLAVLLLDLFEKIMNNNPRSSPSWMSHVNGALALVKVRGTNQFHTYVGLRLSVRLFSNILISCIAADAPVPPAMYKLRQDIEPFLGTIDPKWQVSQLVMEYTTLRGAIHDGHFVTSEVIVQAKLLDDKFRMLAETLPRSRISRRIPVQWQSDEVVDQYYDVYPDLLTVQACNVIRMIRILLHDTCRSAYMDMASRHDGPLLNQHIRCATQMIDALALEILPAEPRCAGIDHGCESTDDFSPSQKMHCYTLLFPFYVAGMYASPGSGIPDQIMLHLKSMASTSGVKNASVVADMLAASERLPPWSIYAILGSYAFAA